MTPEEISPLITVHKQDSLYILRLSEANSESNALSVGIAKLLTGASSILVVTPTATKLFRMPQNAANAQQRASQSITRLEESEVQPVSNIRHRQTYSDKGAPPQPEEVLDEVTRQAQELAEQDNSEDIVKQINREELGSLVDDLEENRPKPVKRDKEKNSLVSAEDSRCSRCGGSGELGTDGITCNVCKGKGYIKKFKPRGLKK